MIQIKKKHEMKNYDFCYGMGVNWYDLENSKFYHIQEYREAIERGDRPEGIRVSRSGGDDTLEVVGEYTLRERMKDKEPDPRY